MRRLAALALVLGVLLPAFPARALDVADCRLWMERLRGETATLPLVPDQRDALLRQLNDVRLEGRRPNLPDAIESVTKFQERTAALARDGRISSTEGARLRTLAETVRRCLEGVGEERPEP